MGNNLLDFVMTLVRDQDMAARYAANPEQVIADAHLDGVQPADVSALIPVVSESVPAAVPADLAQTLHTAIPADNIWASGAATQAFEAFDSPFTAPTHDPSLDAGLHAATGAVSDVISRPDAITIPDQFTPSADSAVAAVNQFQAPAQAVVAGLDLDPMQVGSDLGAAASPVLHDPFLDPTINAEPHHVIDPGLDQF